MRTLLGTIALSGALLSFPAPARPGDDGVAQGAMTAAEPSPQTAPEAMPPPASEPTQPPPAPPWQGPTAPPPEAQAQASVPPGQWVYTAQYGWVWMPYGSAYVYSPPGGYGQPYLYAYYPAYGWTWLVAPWVWGVGPWPHFGVYGPWRFAWYGYGYWRYPWRWHFAPTPHHGFHGVRPAPYWGGVSHGPRLGVRGGAVFRGGAMGRGGGHFGGGHR